MTRDRRALTLLAQRQTKDELRAQALQIAHANVNAAKSLGSIEKIARAETELCNLIASQSREKITPKRKPGSGRKPVEGGTEAEILKAIMALLHRHPKVAKAWRINSGTALMGDPKNPRYVRMNSARGMSDIGGILKNGKAIFVEVKSARGVLRPHQLAFLQSIVHAGGIGMVARSVDDVILALEDL